MRCRRAATIATRGVSGLHAEMTSRGRFTCRPRRSFPPELPGQIRDDVCHDGDGRGVVADASDSIDRVRVRVMDQEVVPFTTCDIIGMPAARPDGSMSAPPPLGRMGSAPSGRSRLAIVVTVRRAVSGP